MSNRASRSGGSCLTHATTLLSDWETDLIAILKVLTVIFAFISPTKKLSKFTQKDVEDFSFLTGMEEDDSDALNLNVPPFFILRI